jgi:cytochrome c peroxidase
MHFWLVAARLAICIFILDSTRPAAAQNTGATLRDWVQGAIDHAQRMRKFSIFETKITSAPRAIFKYQFDLDPRGVLATYQPNGATFVPNSPFFKNLGTNGRTCFSCHQPQDGWGLSAAGAKARFDSSFGLDPLFRLVDGATCPSATVATLADKRKAYKLLIEKGLIRIALPLPPAADLEFEVTSVVDPYKCNTAAATGLTSTTTGIVSVYRRPLPSANLGFIANIMWDGREPTLESQATNATLIHAQANSAPDATKQAQIVAFENGLFSAQIFDASAHLLTAKNATGGPEALSKQQFYLGMNNTDGLDTRNAPFNPDIFALYKPWASLTGTDSETSRRLSIARGEAIYNSGFCATCHNTPNVGSRSVDEFRDIGTSDTLNIGTLDITGLPVFTLTCTKGPLAKLVFKTTDPGRALITGKCADIGRLKSPGLRGLAARAPYFHNGSAATLTDVIDFYSRRFTFNLTAQQKQDLVNFLDSL